MIPDDRIAQFEAMGVEQLRLLIQSGKMPHSWMADATEWAARQERLEKEANDSKQALLMETALKTRNMAAQANMIAIAAIIVMIASIVISILAWLYPRAGG